MILNTSAVIERVKRRKEIRENITELTVIEYPTILNYKKFSGRIYTITEEDKALAIELQIKLRNI